MGNNLTGMGGQPRRTAAQDPGRRLAAPAGTARLPETVGARSAERLISNHLLNALPDEDFARLLPSLEPVSFTSREQLDASAEARYVYFPEDVVVSHLVVFEDGSTVEVAMTGREGFVGLPAVFGVHAPTHWPRVTVQGSALRMRADLCRQEFVTSEAFRRVLLGHAGRHLAQLAQRAACINRHRIENRLAVWLLMLDDRNGADSLYLTQELIARRIGARRAGISEVFRTFQERGYVAHTRGLVRVADRRGLESGACECYALLEG